MTNGKRLLVFINILLLIWYKRTCGFFVRRDLRLTPEVICPPISTPLFANTGTNAAKDRRKDSAILQLEDYLDLSDIISEDDLEIGGHLELIHGEIFPLVDLLEFTRICRKYPIILTLEIENLRAAVDIIGQNCPNVDVNYLIRQKSAGVELFLCCALSWRPTAREWGSYGGSPSSSVPLSSPSQIVTVGQISILLGSISRQPWNVTEFIAKVPHVYHPKYFQRLDEHLTTYTRLADSISHERFSSTHQQSNHSKPKEKFLQLVYSWPSILLVDNLSLAIQAFNVSITAAGICTDKYRRLDPSCAKFIARVLEKEPSALIQPDLAERLALLQSNFPQWDLQRVIFEYPRILTIGWSRFIEKIQEMQVVFGEGCRIEKIIAKHPTILQFNLDRLVSKSAFIASLFPESSLTEVVNSAPGILLSQHSESAVESKVRRVQRLFCRSTSLGGVDIDPNPPKPKQGFQRKEGKKGAKASNQTRSSSLPPPAQKGFDRRNGKATGLQEYEIGEDGISSSEQQLADPVTVSLSPEESTQQESTAMRELESKLEVARIVMGNAETFSDKFPYFIQRLQIWIEAFDPVMAHTILSARPNLLSRDPPEVRSLLKHLYGSTVMAMASLRQDPIASDFSQGRVYEPRPTLFQKSSNCDAFSKLLQGLNEKLFSPSTDAATVMQRVLDVTEKADRLLGPHALGDAGWRTVLFLRAPRLLTEPVWRLLLRIALSKEYFCNLTSNSVVTSGPIGGVPSDSQRLLRSTLLKDSMGDTTKDDDNIGTIDDDDIDIERVLMLAKIEKLADKFVAPMRSAKDNGMADLFLSHGEVLVSPPSTYFRLFFLQAIRADEICTTKQVRDVLKMNTREFVQLLQKSASLRVIDGYARFLDCMTRSLHREGNEIIAFDNIGDDQAIEKSPTCFERMEALERRLCGVLNDLFADKSTAMEDDSPLHDIIRIIRETQLQGILDPLCTS